MKRLILALALASTTLAGCAQLKESSHSPQADAGASAQEDKRPYPKSSSDLGLF